MSEKANIFIDQGADFSLSIVLTDANSHVFDIAGYTAHASMRPWYTSNTVIVFDVSIDANTGTLTLALDATTTAELDPIRYVYDVIISDGNATERIVEGTVTVTPAVTR
jgi:hypothetical protein